MEKAVEQALAETGAAREFPVLREGRGLASGAAPRREMVAGALAARAGETVALNDSNRKILRRGEDQGADVGVVGHNHLQFPT